MSGVKNWLMEMQEYSHHLIESMTVETAREFFIKKYGESQVNVFTIKISLIEKTERQLNLSTKQQEDLEANIKGLKEIMGADYE